MSEANNVWRVDPDGREHEIEAEHSTMTGKIVVKLDGQVVGEDRMLLRQKPVEFDVGGYRARVTVEFQVRGVRGRQLAAPRRAVRGADQALSRASGSPRGRGTSRSQRSREPDPEGVEMSLPPVVSRDEWLAARPG